MQSVPPLQSLKSSYPTSQKEDLAKELGFSGKDLDQIVALWGNTCAVRMSYCLLKCGITLGKEQGRGDETEIRIGALKGKHIWMNQKKLSEHLKSLFGSPTYLGKDKDQLMKKIGEGGGIISFVGLAEHTVLKIPLAAAYPGGHVDVVYYDNSLWTGTLGDRYDLMIQEVGWSSWGFQVQCKRATEIRFWRAS